jgi:magnesium transporter
VTYEEDEAGRWVDHELIVAAQTIRVSEAMRLFRRVSAPYSDTLFLVNRTGRWVGCVHLRSILNAQPHEPVSGFMEEEYPFIDAQTDVVKAADLLEKSEVSALPVLDSNQLLVGRFHAGHALEARRLEQEAAQMSNTGLDEDSDLFSPVRRSAASRGIWLGINLLTAFMASAFIGLFEATLEQVVALAVLMPIVASMGGIAGSQTLTLIVRGLALGQITRANLGSLLKKEIQVGGLNGIVWSLCIGAAVFWWFHSPMLGFTIAMAIVINILMAALSGVIIPVVLDKLKIDPALSGSVILTTVTDIAGYIAFLGLGTLLLL